MSSQALTQGIRVWSEHAAQDRRAPKEEKLTGPVLMGDLHGTWGGQPTLLWLWQRWQNDDA